MRKRIWGMLLISNIVMFLMLNITVFAFSPRTTTPSGNYWYDSSYNPYYSGYTGECTWYVWGRAYEITGTRPTYSPTWGGGVYSACQSVGYSCGSTPKAGSIMCTSGHVAIVEAISGDSMTISEYNWRYAHGFSTETLSVSASTAGKYRGGQQIYGYVYLSDFDSIPDTVVPKISYCKVVGVDSNGYMLECEVTDNIGVSSVKCATWTSKSAVKWEEMVSQGNNKYKLYIKYSDHSNSKNLIYYNDLYAYDTSGNECCYRFLFNDWESPQITNVQTQLSSDGYTISCEVTDDIGVDRVVFPTWTAYNGQDDLDTNWNTSNKYSGIISNSTVTFRVNTSDHNNETGIYKTHIYAYDELGNSKCYPQIIVVGSGYTPASTIYCNNHKYIFFSNSHDLNWEEAKQYCEQIGGHLATITSKAENDALKSETSRLGSIYYFIGGSDKDVENNWKWITGEEFIYTNWESGEPNNNNNEDFLAFIKNGYWNDVKAEHNAYFICETGYTLSTVTKSKNNYTVNIKAYNTTNCEIIVAGYKNGRLVDLKVNPYSESSSAVLTGDIDEIKVMLWETLRNMKPISEPEIISVTQ